MSSEGWFFVFAMVALVAMFGGEGYSESKRSECVAAGIKAGATEEVLKLC